MDLEITELRNFEEKYHVITEVESKTRCKRQKRRDRERMSLGAAGRSSEAVGRGVPVPAGEIGTEGDNVSERFIKVRHKSPHVVRDFRYRKH